MAAGQPLVHDSKVAVDAPFQEGQHRRIARRLGEVFQKAEWTEESVHLLIVENDPAESFEFFVLVLRFEFSGALGEVGEDDARLREFPFSMNEYRHFTHFIDIGPEFRCALGHGTKKIDPDRLPVGADQVEHKCSAIGVAGLSEAIKLVLGHSISDPDVFSVKVVIGVPLVDCPS